MSGDPDGASSIRRDTWPACRQGRLYVYATEAIDSCLSNLPSLAGADVLCVSGSGDQAFNAFAYGARHVTAFDINSHAKYMVALKRAAIETLDLESFLAFFGDSIESPPSLGSQLYARLRSGLTAETRRFWDQAYACCAGSGARLAASGLFHLRPFHRLPLGLVNRYLRSNTEYARTRHLLGEGVLETIDRDLLELSGRVARRFDLVSLSNVPNLLLQTDFSHEPNPVAAFGLFCAASLRPLLKEGGSIAMYAYSPSVYPNDDVRFLPPLSHAKQRRALGGTPGLRLSEVRFRGCQGGRDLMIRLQRVAGRGSNVRPRGTPCSLRRTSAPRRA